MASGATLLIIATITCLKPGVAQLLDSIVNSYREEVFNSAEYKDTNSDYGIRVKLSRKGVNYANRLANSIVDQIAEGLKLQDVSINLDKSILVASDVVVKKYMSSGRIWLRLVSPNVLNWTKENMSMLLNGRLLGKINGVKFFSEFEAAIKRITISMSIRLWSKNGRLELEAANCQTFGSAMDAHLINQPRLHFHTLFMKNKNRIVSKIKETLMKQGCTRLLKFINSFNAKGQEKSTQVTIYNSGLTMRIKTSETFLFNSTDFQNLLQSKSMRNFLNSLRNMLIDFSLTRDPNIAMDTVDFFMKGEISWMGLGETPFLPSNPTDKSKTRIYDKMLYVTVSDYVINSMLYHVYQRSSLKIVLNRKETPHLAKFLRFSCEPTEICVSVLFPELGVLYYDHSLEVQILKSEIAPAIILKPNRAIFYSDVDVVVTAIRRGRPFEILKTRASVAIEFKLWMEELLLKGSASVTKFNLTLLETAVPNITQQRINQLNDFAPAVIESLLTMVMTKGLQMPGIKEISCVNPFLRLLDRKMRIETDVIFSEFIISKLVKEYLNENSEVTVSLEKLLSMNAPEKDSLYSTPFSLHEN